MNRKSAEVFPLRHTASFLCCLKLIAEVLDFKGLVLNSCSSSLSLFPHLPPSLKKEWAQNCSVTHLVLLKAFPLIIEQNAEERQRGGDEESQTDTLYS